ncbi:ATP-binding protein [Rhizorhabdus dicambivorans]|uniref:histidine kinase n=1 Tax=Rhizorhabdus dicambivorans TaxID=1850238 RepID=A0A2A4G3K3_9SPHN|nr:ATP-binding protein [Rhizorhabdus dicambivorans]ATE65117.1 hybrid sensor histidine kinase/response regulator [Rhizorhabdus dicambivorans]PCE44390.1 hybrid sensor histidine kinase/response regulator [Rhizorhabdus dicambivorans]
MATLFPSAPMTASSGRIVLNILLGVLMLVASVGMAGMIWGATDNLLVAGLFMLAFCLGIGMILLVAMIRAQIHVRPMRQVDISLVLGTIEDSDTGIAITGPGGDLVCANRQFESWFGGLPTPPGLPLDSEARRQLAAAAVAARRDGRAEIDKLESDRGLIDVVVRRAGHLDGHLVWRFRRSSQFDSFSDIMRLLGSDIGRRLGSAGVMTALVDGNGIGIVANRVFLQRALGSPEAPPSGWSFAELLRSDGDAIRLAADPATADPVRLIQVPLDDHGRVRATLFLLVDETPGTREARAVATGDLHALLGMLPLGLAVAERDGRVLFMNSPFRRAAGIAPDAAIVYPSDLVVEEDKAAVSDAVRRFSAGRGSASDLSVRLKARPEENVALTIAAAKGLGKASVLLSLKDNSEESKLKRQVAQAMKMQAVGQLAGGVAHDFNNILTAIIGHCDLMTMRHIPGDSDYDDIQQIKHNSNRAAALTRQLLAFSRQQTLRPQILQLPDIISEITNLLKRLLGETVRLEVSHGRNLGTVRADPGQLEQVIVNLAVNARDAMPDGGTLTIQTYGLSQADVRKLGIEIMPVTEYTAMKVTDTGTGIPSENLNKIFEPFFTTKEVGKGTGLGLSTVYGIVKQTGGFIFAESEVGQGTSFVIYLPVHEAPASAPVARLPVKESSPELWGTGTILLVEDEAMVRAVAERALARQGYKILTATNGEEGLEVLENAEEPIDLVISDVVMPTMDGPSMARAAREKRPGLPIIFMSGYAEEQLRRSIDLDNIGFLPKPFSVQQIGQAAREALAGHVQGEAVE